MTKCLLRLTGISILGTLTVATASHATPVFNDLSTKQAIIRSNLKHGILPNLKTLNIKLAGDLTLNQKTTSSNKEPRPSSPNFMTRSECRGSSRREEKQDYSMLDFRFWITEAPCNEGKIDQD
ncbi:MAG: hypothetical protein RID09_08380 [Coleofasciculus sp. G1-WW12-02]|uniref:hypothetical protein n=1 Tax=Coleofasciculus sp. G1-WW12-02 TaxID=3068483 RepID=UPI0032F13E42